ncbi:MAG: hypothetical protein KAT04_05405 [Methylococcales bacterium]|nr:hypothetical protein [Methylococcales bacterium]
MQENQYISEQRKFQVEEGILILLLILSLVGIAITAFSPDDGYGYWIIMVFVFASFAILIAWLQSKHKNGEFKEIVKEQSLHWLTSLLVVAGAFLLQKSGQLTAESAGLVILLILSLATMLDGLRIGWHFSLVGLFLGASSVIGAFYQAFIWIDSAIAITIVFLTFLWEFWMNKRIAL